mmetsp:Transcript_9290/g.28937  ORF Transcript_9290/g.28937 Transcript_9290/m.28937 type:complete len:231 (+) Transcript_9290:326-1018(+)
MSGGTTAAAAAAAAACDAGGGEQVPAGRLRQGLLQARHLQAQRQDGRGGHHAARHGGLPARAHPHVAVQAKQREHQPRGQEFCHAAQVLRGRAAAPGAGGGHHAAHAQGGSQAPGAARRVLPAAGEAVARPPHARLRPQPRVAAAAAAVLHRAAQPRVHSLHIRIPTNSLQRPHGVGVGVSRGGAGGRRVRVGRAAQGGQARRAAQHALAGADRRSPFKPHAQHHLLLPG